MKKMKGDDLECSLSLRKQEDNNFKVINSFKFDSSSKSNKWRLIL
jgi:hypothetical protein